MTEECCNEYCKCPCHKEENKKAEQKWTNKVLNKSNEDNTVEVSCV